MVPTLIPSCAKLPVKSSEVLSAKPLLALWGCCGLALAGLSFFYSVGPGIDRKAIPVLGSARLDTMPALRERGAFDSLMLGQAHHERTIQASVRFTLSGDLDWN